ncbi:MAG TPA: efflux RND transporter permease subunit [Candidatus Baltobacteraceae bacterium]
MSLASFSIRNLWLTVGFWAVVSAAGAFAFSELKYALFPDIAFPVVVVTARSFVDSDAPSTETDVTGPLEAWLRTVGGLSSMQSLTYPGLVTIQLNFDPGNDLDKARQDVEDTIQAADVNRYQLQKLQAIQQAKMEAAMRHGMGPSSAEEAAQYAGVQSVQSGSETKTPSLVYTFVTPINLNETAVSTYTLSSPRLGLDAVSELADLHIASALRNIPGVLRVDVLGASANGKRKSAVRYDGEPALALSVIKNASANTLDVADAVEARVTQLRAAYPNLTIVRAVTQATYIREASHATTDALMLAIALSVLVIWPFLRDFPATLISALAIPTSLLGTTLVMYALKFNLETITLLALALVVGVIVDDAIVVVENIVRHIEAGDSPLRAAHRGDKEIGRTLMAATFTIVAVFLPIGLMGGTLGQFFRPFGITASVAVLLSLLVARSLSPALAAALLRRSRSPVVHAAHEISPADRSGYYAAALRWSLRNRWAVVAIAVVAFVGGLAIVPFIPKGFIPHLDRGEFHVTFTAPPNSSLTAMAHIAATLEQAVQRDPAVEGIYTAIGTQANQPNSGLLDVRLKPKRDAVTLAVENRVRSGLPDLSGVSTSVEDVPFVGTQATKPFEIALVGDDLGKLRAAGSALEARLRATHLYLDLQTTGFGDDRSADTFIQHVNERRAVSISADLAKGVQIGDATENAVHIANKILPRGVEIALGGTSADTERTFSTFGATLALSVVAILAVLVALFGSWLDPLAIGTALPLSVVGALFALWITHSDFGLISLMGVIFLLGLVNKNAILLVDAIKRARANGATRFEAVLVAGEQRLRPILMTTFATILGMLPIALGIGAGAELRQPMAVAIIGGLITSTALSLIVVPVVYTLFDDLRRPRRVSLNPFAGRDATARLLEGA